MHIGNSLRSSATAYVRAVPPLKMTNTIHINKDFGWFIGGFDNNQKHRHYALQLSIPLDGHITIFTSESIIKSMFGGRVWR